MHSANFAVQVSRVLRGALFLIFLETQPLIHVFGDSHVSSFQNLPGSCLHWFHGRTMYRIGRDGLEGLNIKEYGVEEQDVFIFVAGEIDVRCHIGRICDALNRSVDDIIDDLVKKYIKTIQLNRGQYTIVHPFIFCVLPPVDECFNNVIPFYGSLRERVEITQKLNNSLQDYCKINNIGFINVYDVYACEDGSLDKRYSDECVHVVPPHNTHVIRYFLSLYPQASQWSTIDQVIYDRG